MRRFISVAIVSLAVVLGGCANRAADPQAIADETTRGVYDFDFNRTTAHFDDALKAEVTRSSVGELSNSLQALGTYHGLKQIAADPEKGRYDYQASFDKGTLLVRIRLDPDQKLAAYRLVPEGTPGRS